MNNGYHRTHNRNIYFGYFCNCSVFTSWDMQHSHSIKAMAHQVFCCINYHSIPSMCCYIPIVHILFPLCVLAVIPLCILHSHYVSCDVPIVILFSHYMFCYNLIVQIIYPIMYTVISHCICILFPLCVL